jgi:HTH-type transcriptional regulator/antitoxin HigA
MSRIEYNNIVTYHPGYYVKEMIDELDITQDELSKRLEVTSKYMSDFIKGKAKLSDDMALKLSKVFGTSIELWLNLNKPYIEKEIEIRKRMTIDDEVELARKIDYTFFVSLGLLPKKRNIVDKVDELQRYFKVASLKVLVRQDFLVQYKSAIAKINEVNVMNANAWVQTAINIGREIETKSFDEKKLKSYIKEIRDMTVKEPKDFVDKLKGVMSECGVALVFMPHLKNCGVNGAVIWLNDKVILAINDRSKYADFFWFALFHEIGHVFQKRKKLLIISDQESQAYVNSELMDMLEEEANLFAQETLIDEKDYKTFNGKSNICSTDIVSFSKSINLHPGIVVGRLQRDGKLEFNQCNELRAKYEISNQRDGSSGSH